MTFVAISARLNPVDFDKNGTVLEDLGLTSLIYTSSSGSTMNWMLNSPFMPIASHSFSVYSSIFALTAPLMLYEGYTLIESPE